MNTIGHEPGPVNIHLCEGAGLYEHPGEIVFRANGVFNKDFAAAAGFDVDPGIAETEDIAVFDVERLAAHKLDAILCTPGPVDAKVPDNYHVFRPGLDHNSVEATARKDPGNLTGAAVNREGFVDGNWSVRARIHNGNLASGRCLRDGAGKSLTRRAAAARVGVMAKPGNPRPAGLV